MPGPLGLLGLAPRARGRLERVAPLAIAALVVLLLLPMVASRLSRRRA